VAVVLAEVYALVARLAGCEGWVAALGVHAVIALVILIRRPRLLQPPAARFFVPAAVIVLGCAALAAFGRVLGGATARPVGNEQIVWILAVPWAEELVFRAGLGDVCRRFGGPVWGSWFSAIAFALVHAQPTVANLLAFKVGLPLGPFLLALCCEALYVRSAKLLPGVAFHAACNASVVLFAYGDARWLDWLALLYS
jgi:membrane protease YdiL (CAAX protease family)